MKPFVEKLNLAEQHSFYAKTHSTPLFEVGWHRHRELEIIYFREGSGKAFIGNYIGDFCAGDIFFIGADLAHSFQKAVPDLFVSAVVIQFREDFWGDGFLHLPECRNLRELFSRALHGIKLQGNCKELLARHITALETLDDISRITRLIKCLQLIYQCTNAELLATCDFKEPPGKHTDRIDRVYKFTLENYFEPITLEQVAEIAAMSIPAFCNYFKRSTRKTYIEFLNEVRIENACHLLMDSEKNIHEIGFTSGFNTLANFNKQFFRMKKMTPSQYRKLFRYHLKAG
jgi:AraC-like DNA-binding protein/quercetin dioxygenase-like cupin family protein